MKVKGADVNYYADYTGYLATPEAKGQYPGIVMIHEWWGLNENIRNMAKLLANQGYNVLAVDLYGDVATTSDRAGELAGAVRSNPEPAVKNMQAAIKYLKEKTNAQKIASMGWCFGGQQSLNVSLAQKDLAATVIYYGQLTDDQEKLKQLSGPVLGIFGENDSSISTESVHAFEAALNEVGIKNQINIYPGVGHAFANPSGNSYAADETMDAWQKTIEFLANHLK
ncbi:dienelactone hydrolase family protein [Candidatus Peregrinibacteria bacterium]|nr:MAG: dienelactone hydrolase family protein [Candidatus Peregrinibacteria bacterium]